MLSTGSRQLRFAGILFALALIGCGSGPSSGGGNGYASFAWDIFDIEDTSYSVPLACSEVGAATVVVTLMDPVTEAPLYTSDHVNCADMQMSTANVPTGDYKVGVDLYGDPGLYWNATTFLDSFDLAEASGVKRVFHIGPGLNDFRQSYAAFIVRSFVVGWSFSSGSALNVCGAVGAPYVDIVFPVAGSTKGVSRSLSCTAGQGFSYAIPYDSVSPLQWNLYLVSSAGTDLQTLGGSAPLSTTANVNLGTQLFSF
jgi:hypothetical protein